MEQQISLLPSKIKVCWLLPINTSDKILNFLAIDIHFFGKNTLSIHSTTAISCHSCQYYKPIQAANVPVLPPTAICLAFLPLNISTPQYLLLVRRSNFFSNSLIWGSNEFERYDEIMTIVILGAVQKKVRNAITINLKKVAQVYLKNPPARSKKKVAK